MSPETYLKIKDLITLRTMIIFSHVINVDFYLVKRRENEHQQIEAYTAWVNSQLRKRPGMPLVQVY